MCPELTKKDNWTTSTDTNTQLIAVALVSIFLTLNIVCFLFYVSYVNFELVNVSWEFYGYVLIIMQSLNIVKTIFLCM